MRRFLFLLAACVLRGQDLPRGQVIERVVVRDNERQSYALYLPSAYSSEHAWPILYCLDPGARGRVPVERFAQAAERAGFLVAGSNNSRNGPIAASEEVLHKLFTKLVPSLQRRVMRVAFLEKFFRGSDDVRRRRKIWLAGTERNNVLPCLDNLQALLYLRRAYDFDPSGHSRDGSGIRHNNYSAVQYLNYNNNKDG